MINGRTYDWASNEMEIQGLGKLQLSKEIRWTETGDAALVYGKGRTPKGYSLKNYSCELTIKLGRREYVRWEQSIKDRKTTLYSQPPFTVTSAYSNNDEPITSEAFPACVVIGVDGGIAQGDDDAEIEIKLRCTQVRLHNGSPVAE